MSDRFKSFIDFDLLMPSDRVVPGWAQFANEAGLPVWIHWSCVVVNVYTVRKKRGKWKFWKQTAVLRRSHGKDWAGRELK